MYQTNILNLNDEIINSLKWKKVQVGKIYKYITPYQIIAVEPKKNGLKLYFNEGIIGLNVKIIILDYTVLKSGNGEAKIARVVWENENKFKLPEELDAEEKESIKDDEKIRKQFESQNS